MMGHTSIFAALAFAPSAVAVLLQSTFAVQGLDGKQEGCDGCLERAAHKECEEAVEDKTNILCFASGGKNPNRKIGGTLEDDDHYDEPAWLDFPKGGIQGVLYTDFSAQLEANCKYCPAVGYWPEPESSMMIFCKRDAEKTEALLKHCVTTGILLYQDAVLYRGTSEQVEIFKTFVANGQWKETLEVHGAKSLENGQTYLDGLLPELHRGAFGGDFWQEGTIGTKFDEAGDGGTAKQFVFALDKDNRIFCLRCMVVVEGSFFATAYKDKQLKCISPGLGKDKYKGRPCDVFCLPDTANSVDQKKCVSREDQKNAKKTKLKLLPRSEATRTRARMMGLERRLVRWLFGRPRPAQ